MAYDELGCMARVRQAAAVLTGEEPVQSAEPDPGEMGTHKRSQSVNLIQLTGWRG